MDEMQRIIVDDHIAELRRDGDALRADRFVHDHPEAAPRGPADAGGGRAHVARARLGRWLMNLGTAVAGSATSTPEPRVDAGGSGC